MQYVITSYSQTYFTSESGHPDNQQIAQGSIIPYCEVARTTEPSVSLILFGLLGTRFLGMKLGQHTIGINKKILSIWLYYIKMKWLWIVNIESRRKCTYLGLIFGTSFQFECRIRKLKTNGAKYQKTVEDYWKVRLLDFGNRGITFPG